MCYGMLAGYTMLADYFNITVLGTLYIIKLEPCVVSYVHLAISHTYMSVMTV